MTGKQWICPKCGSIEYEQSKVRASGGFLSSMMDINTVGFRVLSCKRCGFAELYKDDPKYWV